jgi:hypothetical protein
MDNTEQPTSWGVPLSKYGDTPTKQNLAIRREILAKFPDYNLNAYAKGWRDSWADTIESPLELGDARGEPDEWYDGFHDSANGLRTRWHRPMIRITGAEDLTA